MSERCDWCKDNGILQKYHDEEWGIPSTMTGNSLSF